MLKKWIVALLASVATLLIMIPLTSSPASAVDVEASQTLTIMGAKGTVNVPDPYTEFSLDNGQTWRRSFLYTGHPWGYADGTNGWLNCGPTGEYCAGMDVLYRVRFLMPNEFSNPRTTFEFRADNAVTVSLNDYLVGNITTQGTVTGSTYNNSTLMPGINEVKMVLHDYGGLTGLNFKISIVVDASAPPTLVTAPLTELPAPTFSASSTLPTRDNVLVTILYPADASAKEYSFNETNWFTYSSAVVMSNNGKVFARWFDPAGSPSNTGTYTVTNIDNTPPATPTLIATPTTPTSGSVAVSFTEWGDAATKQFRVNGGVWQSVPESSEVTLTANGTVEARGLDVAGNVSPIGKLIITWIAQDPLLLQAAVGALNSEGTELTVLFNLPLNTQVTLDRNKFHLLGTAATIGQARYASDQAVVLQLSGLEAGLTGLPTITLSLDDGAVTDIGNNAIVERKWLPVRSQSDNLLLRSQLLSTVPGSSEGPVRIDHVVGYMLRTPVDATGDGRFDRNDVMFLLFQILFQPSLR